MSSVNVLATSAIGEILRREVEDVVHNYIPLLFKLLKKCNSSEIREWTDVTLKLLSDSTPLLEKYQLATSVRRKVMELVEANCTE